MKKTSLSLLVVSLFVSTSFSKSDLKRDKRKPAQTAGLGCIRQTQNAIEAVDAVSKYKMSLVKKMTSEDTAESSKADDQIRALDEHMIKIAMEACEALYP